MYNSLIIDKVAYFDPSRCEWGEWIPEKCSVTCGEGTRWKTRVVVPKEGYVGECEGYSRESEPCKIAECPGKYSNL